MGIELNEKCTMKITHTKNWQNKHPTSKLKTWCCVRVCVLVGVVGEGGYCFVYLCIFVLSMYIYRLGRKNWSAGKESELSTVNLI